MKRKKSFLEFYKTVLRNVKFDNALFWKEYHKALRHLDDSEARQLMSWIGSLDKEIG